MSARVDCWLVEPLADEVARSVQRLADSEDVQRVAVMPDVHLAHEVCVGVAAGTARLLYPQAVGGDIGCGMAALAFEVDGDCLDAQRAARLLDGLGKAVPILHHARGRAVLPQALAALRLSHPRLDAIYQGTGALEHGTLGRGNHFLELQRGDDGRLWVMVHSGSRALGPAVRDHHLALAAEGAAGLLFLDAESDAGRDYLGDLEVALCYADSSRRAMLDAVARLVRDVLGAPPDEGSAIHCHHNHVRRELHDGRWLWVHRKGAIPAGDGERGVIPGSMGSPSYHTEGRGLAAALSSSSHGAGRALPRGEARRRISMRQLVDQVGALWFDHRRADALRDEAPGAYKDVRKVMRAQRELTRVVGVLEPRLVFKG